MIKSMFTQVIQDGMSLSEEIDFAHHEIDAWHAPSECHDLVSSSEKRVWNEFFDGHGWTLGELKEEIKRRGLSPKYIYYNVSWAC